MFKRLPWRRAGFVALIAMVVVMMMMPTAFAARGGNGHGHGGGRGTGGGGGIGGGGGRGGGPGEEVTSNNLSVPAIFVGTYPFDLTCPSGPTDPTGTPLTNYAIDPTAYYYVQGVNTWQAQCATAANDTITADAKFGDNILGGEATLKVGSPIRVEVGLNYTSGATSVPTLGYLVDKLQPDKLDRESAYGTEAFPDGTGGYYAVQTTFPYTFTSEEGTPTTINVRVWDADSHLKIYNKATPDQPVVDEAATAEINATGAVVYGFNLRVQTAGTYVIEFTAPTVTLTTASPGVVSNSGHTVSFEITVAASAGGGGGGH